MDVALCYDDPLRERDPAALPHDHPTGASGGIPGQPHGGVDAQRPGVGEGNLHLRFLPLRPQHRHIPQFSLGADDRDPFIRQILPRLGQRPLRRQGMAEQHQRLLRRHVHMPPGGFQLHKNPPRNGFGQSGKFPVFHLFASLWKNPGCFILPISAKSSP